MGVAFVDDKLYVIGGFNLVWRVDSFFPSTTPSVVNQQYTPIGYGSVPPAVSVVSPQNKTYATANVSLVFTVNKQTSWLGYSLDGQQTVTITGNTTIAGLTSGVHNITVYAKDSFENTGTSKTIVFSIAEEPEPFPTTWVAAAAVSVFVVGAGLLVYFKKRNHQAYLACLCACISWVCFWLLFYFEELEPFFR